MPTKRHKPMLHQGQVLNGRWEIISHIATGGKGEVYRARQLKLEREVAIKIISPEMIDTYDGDKEEIQAEMERFRREVLAMARTRHPNVLQAYDFEHADLKIDGRQQSVEYIIVEYVPGGTLSATIPAHGLMDDEQALRKWITSYFLPILDGVQHIHEQGIVHRDLKPSNVLVDGQTPKIMDFGLVAGPHWKTVTMSHHVIGTLAYMAPEQYVDLAEVDFRADLYSLGKIVYNAAVGRLGKDTMRPLQVAHLDSPGSSFLKGLDRIIRKATAAEKVDRYASVEEMRASLVELLGPSSTERPSRASRVLIPLVLALAGALIWGVWYHFQPGTHDVKPTTPTSHNAPHPKPAKKNVNNGPLLKVIRTVDGAGMHLIPSGQVRLPDGENQRVAEFYISETVVTNNQYVLFLNSVLTRVEVIDGIAKGDGKAWLRLGEVRKAIEPIEFRQGRFYIKDSTLSAHPVVNTTGHGALAYSRHQDNDLPSVAQWIRASGGTTGTDGQQPAPVGDSQRSNASTSMHGNMMSPADNGSKTPDGYTAVTHFAPNQLGVRGMGSSLGEWVAGTASQGSAASFLLAEKGGKEQTGVFFRSVQPWESFPWVGFRSARQVNRASR